MGKLINILLGKPEKPNLRLKGILNEKKAFTGPKIAQVDITNNCNLNCAGCWCHSELMEELKFKGEYKEKNLSLEKIKELIDDLYEMNTEEIQLSGSGDPSMHPDFMEVVEYIKHKGFRLHIITNFTLFNKEKIKKLVDLKIDKITISFWAGTVKTYLKTHPNQTEKTYYKIKEDLQYLYDLKRNKFMPKVRIYNVVSSLNYYEIEEMIDFALEVMAEFIEFQVIDVVEGKSDSLALTEEHKSEILKQFEIISKRKDLMEIPRDKLLNYFKGKKQKEFREFSRFIKKKSYSPGFRYYLKHHKYYRAKCQIGKWNILSDVIEDNVKENAIIFPFRKKTCLKCQKLDTCSIDKARFIVKAEFLSLLGFGSFFRRVANVKDDLKQNYDVNIVDTIPCYIGWTFTRILPNGDVLPCCKAHKNPLGNLHEKSFKDIWYSNKYNEFRFLAKTEKKNHSYFKVINCYKSCDNVGMNLETHMMMKKL